MKNTLREKIEKGDKTLGTFLSLGSTTAIEALGQTGLDYVIIDTEHAPVGIDSLTRYIQAAEIAGLTPIVRLHEICRSAALRALDVGAQGLIVPCVKSVEEVQRLVEYSKFAPLGNRGFCPTRDGRWGFSDFARDMNAYMETCNKETLLIPQCETAECLENIEKIAAVPGADGIFVGPYDLSIAMGIPGQFDNPAFKSAVDRVVKACKAAGKQSHIFTGSEKDCVARFAQGFDSAAYTLDAIVYIKAYRDFVDAVKNAADK